MAKAIFRIMITNVYKCLECTSSDLFFKNQKIECKSCFSSYEFKNYPIFVEQSYTESFGFQWNKYNKTQLDSFNNLNISETRLFKTTNWKKNLKGEFILEAGSGSGRFTEILANTNATIFSFDSSNATEANFKNNSHFKNVFIFRADISNIPLNLKFDKILCLGVLQHTSNAEDCIKSLICHLKPGGELVFDIYKKNFFHIFQWKYILRPFTKRIKKSILLTLIKILSNILYYPSLFTYFFLKKFNNRIYPVVFYHNLIKNKKLCIEFSILDSFDMYSPIYDNPMSKKQIKKMLLRLNLKIINLNYGDNGIVCKCTL